MADPNELQAAKELFAKGLLDRQKRQQIRANKLNFPGNEDILELYLKDLDIPELADYLAWIPYERFENIKKLGQGGFAAVWKGTVRWGPNEYGYEDFDELKAIYTVMFHQETFEGHFAFKEINDLMAAEIVLSVHLSYHIVNPLTMKMIGLSWDEATKKHLLVMECAEGNLENRTELNTEDPEFWLNVLRHCKEIADCLDFMHQLNVLHQDLHPGNIVFCKNNFNEDEFRLIDIGLAVPIGRTFAARGVYGRLPYMPPEIFQGQQYTEKSDVYCLATLMWQFITGVPPTDTACTLRDDGLREEIIPGLPNRLERMIRRSWSPDPSKRPSMRDVAIELSGCEIDTNFLFQKDKSVAKASAETRAFIIERRARYAAMLEDSNAGSTSDGFSFFCGTSTDGNSIGTSNSASINYTSSSFYSHEELQRMSGKLSLDHVPEEAGNEDDVGQDH